MQGHDLDLLTRPDVPQSARNPNVTGVRFRSGGNLKRTRFRQFRDTGLVSGETLRARFNGVKINPPETSKPPHEWAFFAEIFDKATSEIIFYINGDEFVQNMEQSYYDPPEEHANPKQDCLKARVPLRPNVFVGAPKFCPVTGTGRPMDMDEVRVWAGRLAERQIAELRRVLP
jgi:hypothetical protein